MPDSTYTLQGGYEYVLPKRPAVHDILFSDLPLKQQYWRREDWDWKKMAKWTDNQKYEFVKRELNRRLHGLWFMNKGTPTYITGSNYFFLQYFLVPIPEEEGVDFTTDEFQAKTTLVWSFAGEGMMYPQFRRYQQEFFYFLDYVSTNTLCEGGAIAKPRRVGITACFNADCLNRATTLSQKKFSLMNKELKDAMEVNYDPIRYNLSKWESLQLADGSEIFKPQINKLLTKRAHLDSKSSSSSTGLNSVIYVNTTVENANDGTGTYRLIRDEVSKYPPDIDISNMHFILRPVAKVGTRQVGKIFFFGTSAEKDTKNFERWKTIYFNSTMTDPKTKTVSGLLKYHISGKYAIEGTVIDANGNEVELFDRYGECKEDLAIRWIQAEMQPYIERGDMASVQALKRQYPIEESDSFDSVTDSSCYDTVRLTQQLYDIDTRQKEFLAGLTMPFVTRGRLEWVIRDLSVRFVPMNNTDNPKNNNWFIYRLPNERWINKNYYDRYKILNPDDTSPYLWTCDPIDYRNYLSEGSLAAIIVGSLLDSSLPNGGETIDARYLFRPANPNEVIENVRMAAIFWAAKGTPEINKAWLAVDLIKGRDDERNMRPNYGRFLLTYDKNIHAYRQWRYNDGDIAGIFTGTGSTEAYVRDTNVWLREPKVEGERDRLKALWDAEIIRQWKSFDPKNTQKFDAAVAASLYCTVLKNYNPVISSVPSGLSDTTLIRAWYGFKEQEANKNPLIAK